MNSTNSRKPQSKFPLPDQKFFRAMMADDPEAMAALAAQGADLNVADFDDYTPLIIAVMNHKPKAVAFLLRHPEVNVEYEENLCGMTAEQHAACYPEESPVRHAFREFHLVRTYHPIPYYSFLTACAKGDLPVVEAGLKSPHIKQLLNKNRIPPLPDRLLSLPLINAVWSDSAECVRLLLEAGADPDIENFSRRDHGLTPRQVAKKNPAITRLLEEYDGKRD